MKTIKECLNEGITRLAASGIPDARVDVEWLLEHVTAIRRLELPLNYSRELNEPEWSLYLELIQRRGRREPLQHILGSVNFLGHDIQVSKSALIPRPETERLAELAIERLRALDSDGPLRVLDFGTGTACLAIALVKALPDLAATALDISASALDLARTNLIANDVSERVELVESDGFTNLAAERQFDLVVSNPPYIPRADIRELQQEVKDFDPHLALDGGQDGLNFYRDLAAQGKRYIVPEGGLMLEFGDGQTEAIQAIFNQAGWAQGTSHHDLCDRSRFLEFWAGNP